jgi:uncharacterized protein YjgD (DUF1641 family)
MAEQELQIQIGELNRKLDLLLESIELQNRKREEFDDLVEDVSIVTKDAFQQTVMMLDKAQVDLDHVGITNLFVRILQNLGTFHEMLEMLESASDFMKDVTPILHQVGLDAVNKMNELDQKGYFELGRGLIKVMDQFVTTFTPEDMKRMQQGMVHLTAIMRNLTDPEVMATIEKITKAVAEVKMEDVPDKISWMQLLRQMSSPGFRRSLSYTIRFIESVNK